MKKNLKCLSLNNQSPFQELKVSPCSYTWHGRWSKEMKFETQIPQLPDVPHSALQTGEQTQEVVGCILEPFSHLG